MWGEATAHPIFDAVRPWLPAGESLEALNRAAETIALRTESGRPLRFVAPSPSRQAYETRIFETGCVPTRPGNRHDWFNALAWLAFPRTKARINAMHAAQIPLERGTRGRLRDLLTIFDEGGVLVVCADECLNQLVRDFAWKELFWAQRERVRQHMRLRVLGHAVLEQALKPWPGITCKALFVAPDADPDAQAAQWLASVKPGASPKDLAPLPVFGYPAWSDNDKPEFYDNARYFRVQGKAG